MKKLINLTIMSMLLLTGMIISAQETSTSANTTTINWYFTACETQGIVDLNGTMEAGYDIYIQVFDGFGGTGNAISALNRVAVSGDYQVSATVPYTSGTNLLLGQAASIKLTVGRESNAESTIFSTTVDDFQDGCATGAFSSVSGTSTGSSTPLVDPATGQVINPGEFTGSSGILSPFGGYLNPIYAPVQEAIVQIGARPSELTTVISGRTNNPGLIFAECNAFPLSDPGRLFDTDTLIIFWSWYARTPAQVQAHINNAQYEVFLSSPYTYRQPFPNVQTSAITRREDGNYWVFYTANLGNGFRPGEYNIDYYVTWDEVTYDGYDDYGPETDYPFLQNTCTFNVEPNPYGVNTTRNNPTIPLQQN